MSRPFGIAYLSSEKNGGRDMPNYGNNWTSAERDKLAFMFGRDYTLKDMCMTLRRPASGILSKLVAAKLIHQTDTGYTRGPKPECLPVMNPCGEVYMPLPAESKPVTFNILKEETMSAYEFAPKSAIKAPVIATRTFIDGQDAESMTDSALFSRIAQLEDGIKKLELISNKPKKLLAQIEQHKQDITALVAYVDSRE